jgi:hypothetical protein
MRKLDLSGRVFGQLTVLREDGHKGVRVAWLCRCACGNNTRSRTADLTAGKTLTCGCVRDARIGNAARKHGMTRTPTYISWLNMKQRATNAVHPRFRDYGARGIVICERWLDSFENFLADMGERPAGKSLDRIDNEGDYAPSNCRWATPTQQAANQRRSTRPRDCKSGQFMRS